MNKGTTIDPKRGQVWSLKVKDPEEESPSVLLLEDPGKRWFLRRVGHP